MSPPAPAGETRIGVGVLLLRDGRVLLGERRGSHGAGTWAPPGGHLEYGETPEACARREVLEETGLVVDTILPGPYSVDVFPELNRQYVTLFVVAPAPAGEPVLREPEKCAGWAWWPWDALPAPLFAPLASLKARGFTPPGRGLVPPPRPTESQGGAPLSGTTSPPTPDDAITIVRRFEAGYAAAFDRRDAAALAALFTDDATIVTEWGDLVVGRAEFERGLARAFARLAGELTLENVPAHARLVAADVIVSHGTSRLASATGEHRLAYTRVLVRRGDGWRLAATQVAAPSTQPDPRAGGG